MNNMSCLAMTLPVVYIYRNSIILNLNNWYIQLKDVAKKYIHSSFVDIELTTKILNNSEVTIYKYSFDGDEYIILANSDVFTKTPYTIEHIRNSQISNSTVLRSKDNIIIADLITTENKSINCIEQIHRLCGPLGDFYKDTIVEISPCLLKQYLENALDLNIKTVDIMTSLGDEINLVS